MSGPESLPEVVLAFCRECLGWNDANPAIYYSDSVSSRNGTGDQLIYTDHRVVLKSVRSFCEAHGLAINIYSVGGEPYQVDWLVNIGPKTNGKFHTTGAASRSDLGHSLMAACVESARDLRSTNQLSRPVAS